jgi:hypothetical protein
MYLIQGIALATSLLAVSVNAAASQAFTWNNVRIGGRKIQEYHILERAEGNFLS